ncbi:MAG: large-conductance mechanosensitive channel protein MscL [Proteobacteria bacterium]|nr:large-conductance mechanosensitive channel protein MscL [Pseudomonadota bacterium]
MMSEFKKFAVKGNVMDMAVGIIIGAAFGKIVSAFVSGIMMPPLGLLMGGVDFSDLVVVLKEASEGAEAVTWKWGLFVQTGIDFLIVAFAVFMMIKMMNNMQKQEEETPEEPPKASNEELLLTEIRDLLKSNS